MPCILFVTDFFYPDLGGVETHVFQLSQRLMDAGYKIVVMTRFRKNRHGVRWMRNGLKVYYLPFFPVFLGTGVPNFLYYVPLLRQICIREEVDIVHGHAAASDLVLEAIMFYKIMGYPTVFTDHSMFGFADAGGINLNKILRASLEPCLDLMIAVSQAAKENGALRSHLPEDRIYVIPNAVECADFTPEPDKRPDIRERINIVVISRLAPRKGVDLLKETVAQICLKHRKVHFIIGGDGPQRLDMEEMIEKYYLFDQVTLLGSINSTDVRNVLVQGHIFLNTSLTETFCIALLEAASCGLVCVSTNVGGVPEVLPPHLVRLAPPDVKMLIEKVEMTIEEVQKQIPDAWAIHEEVRKMYTWYGVAKRTTRVYDSLLVNDKGGPKPSKTKLQLMTLTVADLGVFWGKIWSLFFCFFYLYWCVLDLLWPEDSIPRAFDIISSEQREELRQTNRKSLMKGEYPPNTGKQTKGEYPPNTGKQTKGEYPPQGKQTKGETSSEQGKQTNTGRSDSPNIVTTGLTTSEVKKKKEKRRSISPSKDTEDEDANRREDRASRNSAASNITKDDDDEDGRIPQPRGSSNTAAEATTTTTTRNFPAEGSRRTEGKRNRRGRASKDTEDEDANRREDRASRNSVASNIRKDDEDEDEITQLPGSSNTAAEATTTTTRFPAQGNRRTEGQRNRRGRAPKSSSGGTNQKMIWQRKSSDD